MQYSKTEHQKETKKKIEFYKAMAVYTVAV
jgi:hypothetical protein